MSSGERYKELVLEWVRSGPDILDGIMVADNHGPESEVEHHLVENLIRINSWLTSQGEGEKARLIGTETRLMMYARHYTSEFFYVSLINPNDDEFSTDRCIFGFSFLEGEKNMKEGGPAVLMILGETVDLSAFDTSHDGPGKTLRDIDEIYVGQMVPTKSGYDFRPKLAAEKDPETGDYSLIEI